MPSNVRSPALLLICPNMQRLDELEQEIKEQTAYYIVVAECVDKAEDILRVIKVDFIAASLESSEEELCRFSELLRGMNSHAPPFVVEVSSQFGGLPTFFSGEHSVNIVKSDDDHQELIQFINKQQRIYRKTPRVLLIERDDKVCEEIVFHLEGTFHVDIAVNTQQALSYWSQEKFDIVLYNPAIEKGNDLQVVDVFLESKPEQYIALLVGSESLKSASEFFIKGGSDILVQPVSRVHLLDLCNRAVTNPITSTDATNDNVDKRGGDGKTLSGRGSLLSRDARIERVHHTLLDRLSTVVIEVDVSGELLFLNRAWTDMTGFEVDDCIGTSLLNYVEFPVGNLEESSTSYAKSRILNIAGVSKTEFKIKNISNKIIWVEAKLEYSATGNRLSGTLEDISSRKNTQRKLEHLTTHDALTGLYNRHYFEGQLRQFAATAGSGAGPHSLFYIDLDHFKLINDSVGHRQGDLILKEIADSLYGRIRDTDILCRVGGDEFALLLPNTNTETALRIAEELRVLVNNTHYEIKGQVIEVCCSIGICEITENVVDIDEFMKQADIALYSAKEGGRNLVQAFDLSDEHSHSFKDSLRWLNKVRRAVADDRIILHFQPVYNIKKRRVSYYEALARLEIDGELVLPGNYIPAIERAGEMRFMDKHVIKKSIEYLSQYSDLNKIAINLSAQGFGDENFVPYIEDCLSSMNVDPGRLVIELTESASLVNIGVTNNIVNRLAEIGCRFSIDDFGSGFSTFEYLKQLPAESVKIDGSFITDITNNVVDQVLVKAIYDVASALGKVTVAEYVENEETLELLSSIGVTYAQGYYLGKPQPIERVFLNNVRQLIP